MKISLLVAKGVNNAIGYQNKLPWRLASDLEHFHQITLNHHVLMGRKTFESIGRVLEQRTNMVLSRNPQYRADGVDVFHDIKEAMDFAVDNQEDELCVIGGAEIYSYFLQQDLAEKIYLTTVHYDGQADTFFPRLNYEKWNLVSERFCLEDEQNDYNYTQAVLERKAPVEQSEPLREETILA